MTSEWQPIETAPKDEVILLAGAWIQMGWEIQMGRWLVNRFPYVGQDQPTHWQPLPAPPENQQ